MGRKMVVLEGKTFSIELQSMLGSSGYGWCLSGLPKGIILEGEERIATGPAVSPTLQRFYFGVSSAEEAEGEITFAMACTFEPKRIEREYKVELSIIPSDSEDFVAYSENANQLYGFELNQANRCNTMNSAIPYGVLPPWERAQVQKPYGVFSGRNMDDRFSGQPVTDYVFPGKWSPLVAYGVPQPKFPVATEYGLPQPAFPCTDYGYPCGVEDACADYTNNCVAQDAGMKYGYFCGVQDAGMKYGYFCGVQDAVMKYGYPCGAQSATNEGEPFITRPRYPRR